ncbi:hypothetical protein [Rhodococcus opacus]|uniref:hypothetical protein n=1 Tax=Rhodococcus opacus TaxID=37919 RepID=UPI002474398A|nr:hypothetical protein [Rhodococcus opacus]MDH6288102.1 putative membrane protein [Rhodococcus opacus]
MNQPGDPWFLGGTAGGSSETATNGTFHPTANPFLHSIASAVTTPAPKVGKPPSIYLAFGSLLVAAVLSVVSGVVEVLSILGAQRRANRLLAVDTTGRAAELGGGYVDGTATGLMWVVVGLSVVFAAIYVVFSVAVFKGRGWPRIAGTVLAVISLFGLLSGPIVVVTVLSGIVAVAALWVPTSRRYCEYAEGQRRIVPAHQWGYN